MEFNMTFKLFGKVLTGFLKKRISDKTVINAVKDEYKKIALRAKDIGGKNNLLSSYAMAAYFIAMNRCDGLSAEENIQILEEGLKTSKLVRMTLGSGDGYFDAKKTEHRKEWSKETHEHKYENDWVVDILPKCEDYELGYDYHECGVCKLCEDEGCFELAKYLCRLDWLLVELIGIHLERTQTLAEGGEKCDFRFQKK